jgi:tetratricopeptide (TPR) repeat protein
MPPPRKSHLPPANKTFVDREAPQKIFEDAAFSIPADRSTILVFYGVGGQGKTCLCRELMRKTDPQVEPSYAFLRRAMLDLQGRTKEDPDRLLVWIRNGFAEAGVVFPCFDLAFAITWEATKGEEPFPTFTRPWLGRATKVGTAGVDAAASAAKDWLTGDDAKELIGDFIGSVPGVGFILKRIGHWVIEKGKRVYLEQTREALKELYHNGEIKKPYELSSLLPWMLAQDLNSYLTTNPTERFVLFIDEYERVFDERGAGSNWNEKPIDSHIRALIAETNGMLTVFFSREQLPWGIHPDWRDALNAKQHLLGGLAERDADAFLLAIPIGDKTVRQAIISGARETPSLNAPVYPLILDLLVEHWRALTASGSAPSRNQFRVTAESFEGRRQDVVKLLMGDYGVALKSTIERLSVARRFDYQAFAHIVQTFGTALPFDQFERLTHLSFVTQGADGFLTIHNAIAETIRETLTRQRRDTSIEALFRHFEQRAKVVTIQELSENSLVTLVEAAFLRLAQGEAGYIGWLRNATEVFVRTAWHSGVLTQLWREAANIAETRLGRDHLDTAIAFNMLAILLDQQGDLSGARFYFEKVAGIRTKILGEDNPLTAEALTNFAGVLGRLGDFTHACELFKRALAIFEKALGLDHLSTGINLTKFAGLLRDQGDLPGARCFVERAVAIFERELGFDHPTTVSALNNLAGVIADQGDFVGAQTMFERVLAIRERLWGPDHPDTASTLHDFAGLLYDKGNLTGARELCERALAIRERVLDPDHPDTALNLDNLAEMLRAQGDPAAARRLYERALAIRMRVLGPEHPNTVSSSNNLAELIRSDVPDVDPPPQEIRNQ